MTINLEADLPSDAPATTATGFVVDVNASAHGSISTPGDVDFIRVDLVAGESYSFAMVGIGTDALTGAVLQLYGTDGTTLIGSNSNGLAQGNALISFTATISGSYFLAASGGVGSYGVAASLGTKADLDGAMIAGLIDSHLSWSPTRGTAAALTFGFSDTITHGATGFQHFTEAQKEATRAILAHFAEIAGTSFTEVDSGNGYTDAAVMLFGNYAAADGLAAWSGAPGDSAFTSSSGDVWINTATPPLESPLPGSADYLVMLREIAHALGLGQPGLYPGGPGGLTYADDAQIWQDSTQFTVMSAFGANAPAGSGLPAGIDASNLQPDSLGIYDMAALQLIYGANQATRAGNSTYGFNSTEVGIYDFEQNIDPMLTIWDGGGHDMLNLSLYAADQVVRLEAGSHSSVGGFVNNLGLAFGTLIEDARGGRGDDSLYGNALANALYGQDGADLLQGGDGDDTLYGGAGTDTLIGGLGADVLYGEDIVSGVAQPDLFHLVATDPGQTATLGTASAALFPTQSFTLEMVWQQQATGAEITAARFGNFEILRHADGQASLHFTGATEEPLSFGILPPALTDGDPHRLSIIYDDLKGWLHIYLDGAQTAQHKFPSGTRALDATGEISFADSIAVGDIRIFDHVRSAQ